MSKIRYKLSELADMKTLAKVDRMISMIKDCGNDKLEIEVDDGFALSNNIKNLVLHNHSGSNKCVSFVFNTNAEKMQIM